MTEFWYDLIPKIALYLACGLLPTLLFILSGIRHWHKKEITIVSGNVIHDRRPQIETIQGDLVPPVAAQEIGIGCLIFLMSTISIFAPFLLRMVDWIALPGTEMTIRKTIIWVAGVFPGLVLLGGGIWMRIQRKAWIVKPGSARRFWKKFQMVERPSAMFESYGYILIGLLILLLSIIFLI
jgi:hypothetical protein